MAATELFCQLFGINLQEYSKPEIYILETALFLIICEELKEIFRSEYINYFRILKFDTESEKAMLEASFMRDVIKDILITEEYSLTGIAHYTQTPEEVICDLFVGKNTAPSLPLSRKIIDLHKSVRPNLYRKIMEKFVSQYKST